MVAVLKRSLPTQADFHAAISDRSSRWYAACLRITHSAELAEDAVQDALLTAWQKRQQYQGDAQLSTWIHRIAVNAALQLLRKQRPGVFEPLEIDIPDDGNSPETHIADEQAGDQLAMALSHLSEFERVCFVLKHMEQWRLTEIADELGANVSAVKQALFRGVKKLRVKLSALRRQPS